MIRRVAILTAIVLLGFLAIAGWGFHALGKWQAGLAGERLGQFAKVAEAIGRDVKEQLDDFLAREQQRPYTDYLYFHVAGQQQALPMRSPLNGRLDHGLAYGHFQVESDGTILTPNDNIVQREGESPGNRLVESAGQTLRQQLQDQLVPRLQARPLPVRERESGRPAGIDGSTQSAVSKEFTSPPKGVKGKGKGTPAPAFKIDSLGQQKQQAQVVEQKRSLYSANYYVNNAQRQQQMQAPGTPAYEQVDASPSAQGIPVRAESANSMDQDMWNEVLQTIQPAAEASASGKVSIRIEPFVPIQVPGLSSSVFGGTIFLVRHVLVEGRHLLQGFQLQEDRLLELIRRSAERFALADDMVFSLSRAGQVDSIYERRLDFGFGELVLSLMERNPDRLQDRSRGLRVWYLGMVGVVAVVVGLGLIGLWRGVREQLDLARKKDDFISAVSHELRTPLTSIRMYAEMLEQDWVSSPDKRKSYYSQIRQESERLSRLIENVLDFSRVQRGRKKFSLVAGDLNTCLQQIVETLVPYAQQHGFVIETEFADLPSVCFDRDAVSQIVVNLVDNAVKYAAGADKKMIWVRTSGDERHVYIEVEDRGPGVPVAQRQKIFDQFYRMESEATRQTRGTGLGLALVMRFAEAHRGFVTFRSAHPMGAVFQVALARSA